MKGLLAFLAGVGSGLMMAALWANAVGVFAVGVFVFAICGGVLVVWNTGG